MTPPLPAHLTPPLFWLVLALLLAALFLAAPELDLMVSGVFHDPATGFVGRNLPWLMWIHDNLHLFVGAALLTLLAGLALSLVWPRQAALRRQRRALVYLLCVLVVGPGLVVNTLLKDQWGRARPSQVQEFGGDRTFTPAWVISRQCARNCSFVSGDASVGFSLLALGFVTRRRHWFVLGGLAGAGLGLMRIAQGGHFLSDVVFSFFAVLTVAWLLRRLILPRAPEPAAPGRAL